MTRFTIDVGHRFDEMLVKMAQEQGVTKAEIIRRAVAVYTYLYEQTHDGSGNKVSISDKDDKVIKDVVLP